MVMCKALNKRLGGLLVLTALAVGAGTVGLIGLKVQRADADLAAQLKREVPAGSSPEKVIAALDRHQLEHSGYLREERRVTAIRRDVKRSVWTSESEVLEFRFDAG